MEENGKPLSRRETNVVFAAIALGMLLAALDQTIVGTALPRIVADLGGAEHLSWVVTSYLLAQTVATALAGKFGDLFGRKRIFQVSTVVFITGSFLCGFADSMEWLIASRGLQGIGGGGLMVTASALIGDLIPLRDRGRYQGAIGAVFGISTVVGPLLGGLFTDHLTWRWAFYVNVPLAIVVVIVAAIAMPSRRSAAKPIIDYPGIILVSLGAAGLTLATSWGGTTYAWSSPQIIGLFVGSALALALFVVVELRAKEPTLPMRLFHDPVFTVCAVLSFIVGFAMLGAMTYLPVHLQYVEGVSATASGLHMLPMVGGLFVASMSSGQLVSRTGHYKTFPIAGSAVMAVGLWLLSRVDENTSTLTFSLYLVVLGIGIGLCMQVLVLVVQNTVPYRDLGVATSGVTFFRTLGSSFGAAVFGTVYANELTPKLAEPVAKAMAVDPRVNPKVVQNPSLLHQLPAPLRDPIVHAYAEALHVVFVSVVPVAVVGLVLALFLKQVPMRGTAKAAAPDTGQGFAQPESGGSSEELERLIARLVRTDGRAAAGTILKRSGSSLEEAGAWAVSRVYLRTRVLGTATLPAIAAHYGLPVPVLEPTFERLAADGFVDRTGDELTLTTRGRSEADKLAAAWREWLTENLADWGPDRADLDTALDNVAHRLVAESDHPEAALTASTAPRSG